MESIKYEGNNHIASLTTRKMAVLILTFMGTSNLINKECL
jgi:hypothetical protein